MKKFWKDYCDLCQESTKFYKKHWFGRDEIKDRIDEKFSKKDESESQ